MNGHPPRLTVVLAATRPWDELRDCLRSLAPQRVEISMEVIVGDAHAGPVPGDFDRDFPWVHWIRREGESVFVLRNLGALEARAPIVAFTEDHCVVAPDWCRCILQAHDAHPEAAAIGGVVENGPTRYLIDWANYLLVFGPFAPPVRSGPATIISLQANCSYKRDSLPSKLTPNGLMEFLLNRELLERGRMLYVEGAISVMHTQSHGRLGTFAAHFHNGRSIATVRMEALCALQRSLRITSCFVLPLFLFLYVVRHIAPKPRYWGRYLSCVHLICGLCVAHAMGEFCGYAFGPGTSMESVV